MSRTGSGQPCSFPRKRYLQKSLSLLPIMGSKSPLVDLNRPHNYNCSSGEVLCVCVCVYPLNAQICAMAEALEKHHQLPHPHKCLWPKKKSIYIYIIIIYNYYVYNIFIYIYPYLLGWGYRATRNFRAHSPHLALLFRMTTAGLRMPPSLLSQLSYPPGNHSPVLSISLSLTHTLLPMLCISRLLQQEIHLTVKLN